MNPKRFIRYPYVQLFSPVFCALAFVELFTDKQMLHIAFNKLNAVWLDWLFKYLTHLGHGISVVFVVAILAGFKLRTAIGLAISGVITMLSVQFSKHVLFSGSPRPVALLQESYQLHLVQGVNTHFANSFPSGHTATGFMLCFWLWCSTQHVSKLYAKASAPFFLFLAWMIGMSRIYLSQHFFLDVLVGSLYGMFAAWVGFAVSISLKRSWADKGIRMIFKQ